MTKHGVYVGNAGDDLAAWEAWAGVQAAYVGAHGRIDNGWSDFETSLPYVASLLAAKGRPLELTLPMIPRQGSTGIANLADAAAGAYDAHYDAVLRNTLAKIPANLQGDIPVCLGKEFNGSWMPWASLGKEEQFKSTFRRVSAIGKAISPRYKFGLIANVGEQDPRLSDPGDNSVDFLGMDFYRAGWEGADPVASFETMLTRTGGLNMLAQWGADRGLPIAISEYGVKDVDNFGAYFARFFLWCERNAVLYANYWESMSEYQSKLSAGLYPATGKVVQGLLKGAACTPAVKMVVAPPVDTRDTLTLRVSGDVYATADNPAGGPHFTVKVDGVLVGSSLTSAAPRTAPEDIVLRGIWGPGPHTLALQFTDNTSSGSADRNLHVYQIGYNGAVIAGDAVVSNTGGSQANGAAHLYANGTVTYRIP